MKEASRDRPSGVFGSFGWSGEAVDLMEKRLKDGGFKFAFKSIRQGLTLIPPLFKLNQTTLRGLTR